MSYRYADWNPDRSAIPAAKGSFVRDYANLLRWPGLDGGVVVGDHRVRAFFDDPASWLLALDPSYHRDVGELLVNSLVMDDEALVALVRRDPTVMWLTAGSSLTVAANGISSVREVLRGVRRFAVVSGSAFADLYAGISIFDGKNGLRQALFYGGHILLRPASCGPGAA